jgi:predicted hydrocarbon binding protein
MILTSTPMIDILQSDTKHIYAQILLEGAREILSEDVLNQMLEAAFSKSGCCVDGDQLTWLGARDLMAQLEMQFGLSGSQGLALRMGRAAFKYGLQVYGEDFGFRDTEFRLLPAPRRMWTGLNTLAQKITETYGQPMQVTDRGAFWEWRVTDDPQAAESAGTAAMCFLLSGLLQAFLNWAGGGRIYRVNETECRLSGSPACVFMIEKKPID